MRLALAAAGDGADFRLNTPNSTVVPGAGSVCTGGPGFSSRQNVDVGGGKLALGGTAFCVQWNGPASASRRLLPMPGFPDAPWYVRKTNSADARGAASATSAMAAANG